MKYHGIEMQGPFISEIVSEKPAHTSAERGRIYYDETTDEFYFRKKDYDDYLISQDLANPDKGAAMVARSVICFSSVEEIESNSFSAGTVVYLAQEGRAGEFVVKTGTPPSDPQKAIYIVLANGNYAERQYSGALNIKWFGAVGDFTTDDTDAIEAALVYIDSLGSGISRQDGGSLLFGNGSYKVTRELNAPTCNLNILGTGRMTAYPSVFVPGPDTLPTIVPVHASRNMFKISGGIMHEITLNFHGINFATLETGLVPEAAFGFNGGDKFQRDFTFTNCGIFGFKSAFDLYKESAGGQSAMGVLKVENCAINRNNWIARCLDETAWNSFKFIRNEAGQNRYGLDLQGPSISILGNLLEGQANTIRIIGTYRGLAIRDNYFESNSGDYVIWLQSTNGAQVSSNYWHSITATVPLKLSYDVNTTVDESDVTPSCLGSINLSTKNGAIDPNPLGSASVLRYYDESLKMTREANGVTTIAASLLNATGYHKNIPSSAGLEYISSGNGLFVQLKTGLSLPTGSWIGVSMLVTYDDVPALPPRMELRVNSTNTDGFTDPMFYGLSRLRSGLKGKTVVYFGLIKAKAAVTSMEVYFYPFGVNPAAGLRCVRSIAFMYDYGTSLDGRDGGTFQPFVPLDQCGIVTAPPASGTWKRGWILYSNNPAAGGFHGYRCVDSGSPGTWKGFGQLEA